VLQKYKTLINKPPSKLVAVVVPLSNRTEFEPEEKISLKHLMHFLGKYDKYFVAPPNLPVDNPDFGVKRFDEKFFGSAVAHNKLMLSPQFYEAFIDYKYILIYHLDALVFSDQLTRWCEMDFDYVAPPWINVDMPFDGRVGNGGFSLRNVRSFLKVMGSSKRAVDPDTYWKMTYASRSKPARFLNLPKKYLKHLKIFNNVRWELSKTDYYVSYRNEDYFWGTRATHYCPTFNVVTFEKAFYFGFECVPQICFEKTNHTLPFGCHAWPKYDRVFWEPYLLK